MAYCYLCGSILPPNKRRVRRTVKTGEWSRKSFRNETTSSVQSTYGKRLVCLRCMKLYDRRKESGDLIWHLSPFIGLLILYLATLFI